MWVRKPVQHEGVLALGVGEELDRLDVGVAVDDAAREAGARLGHRGRALAHRRHQLPDGEDVEGQATTPTGAISQGSRPTNSYTVPPT